MPPAPTEAFLRSSSARLIPRSTASRGEPPDLKTSRARSLEGLPKGQVEMMRGRSFVEWRSAGGSCADCDSAALRLLIRAIDTPAPAVRARKLLLLEGLIFP